MDNGNNVNDILSHQKTNDFSNDSSKENSNEDDYHNAIRKKIIKLLKKKKGFPSVDELKQLEQLLEEWYSRINSKNENKNMLTNPEETETTIDESNLFSFIHELNPKQIYYLLENENLEIIAICLCNIDLKISAEVIKLFPEDIKIDLINRISKREFNASSEILEIIAKSLKNKISISSVFLNSKPIDGKVISKKILPTFNSEQNNN